LKAGDCDRDSFCGNGCSLQGEMIMKTKTNVKAGGGYGGILQVGLVNLNDVNTLNNILSGNTVNILSYDGNSSCGCGCGCG
jgi:hypothetical protein